MRFRGVRDGSDETLEISEEERATGLVSPALYWNYIRTGITTLGVILLILLCVVIQGEWAFLWRACMQDYCINYEIIMRTCDHIIVGKGVISTSYSINHHVMGIMGVNVEWVISQFLIAIFLKERKLPLWYLILVHGWPKFTTKYIWERNGGEKKSLRCDKVF